MKMELDIRYLLPLIVFTILLIAAVIARVKRSMEYRKSKSKIRKLLLVSQPTWEEFREYFMPNYEKPVILNALRFLMTDIQSGDDPYLAQHEELLYTYIEKFNEDLMMLKKYELLGFIKPYDFRQDSNREAKLVESIVDNINKRFF